MRIGYVGSVPPLQGGISQHGGLLVEALRRQGHDVHVETWASQYPQALYKGGRQRHDGAWPPGTTARLRWWNPIGWLAAGRRLRDRDLLVFPWITPLQAPAIRAVRAAAGVPACFVVHNTTPHESQPLVQPLTRWAFGGAARLIVHTAVGAAHVRDLGLRVEPVVSPMPPLVHVEPGPLPSPGPLRLLFFGFIRPYKGIEHLVDAVVALRSDGHDVALTIAGKSWGDTADRIRESVAASGSGDHIVIRSEYIPDEELTDLFAAHHVVVLPYTSATQSGVTPIALAAHRPVVVTDVGGLAEQIRDGDNGVCVAPDDPAALAEGILRVAGDYDAFRDGAMRTDVSWSAMARAVAGT